MIPIYQHFVGAVGSLLELAELQSRFRVEHAAATRYESGIASSSPFRFQYKFVHPLFTITF